MVAWRHHRRLFTGVGALRSGRDTGRPLAGPPRRACADDGRLLRRDAVGVGMGVVRNPARVLSGLGRNWARHGYRAVRARVRRRRGLVRAEASKGVDCGDIDRGLLEHRVLAACRLPPGSCKSRAGVELS